MPRFEITGPDGKKYEVNAPEGSDQNAAIEYIKNTHYARKQDSPPLGLMDKIKDSPIGGLVRGSRDVVDGGAQLLTRGIEGLAPSGSAIEKYMQNERMKVEGINNAAEQDYKQNWRGGVDPGMDLSRIVGSAIAAAPFAPAIATASLPGAMATGSGIGALTGLMQPVDAQKNPDFISQKADQALYGGLGGAVGGAVGHGIGKLLKPVPRAIDNSVGVNAADRIGMQLTPGQKTGSTGLQQVEAVLSRTPGSAGMFDRIKDLNQGKLNAAAAKSIGESADNLGEDVIAKASQRISQTFDDLSAKSNVTLGQDFNNLIGRLKANNDKLGSFRNPQVDSLIEKSTELAKLGNLPGDVYQVIRSELTSSADDAYRAGNSAAGKAMKDIRNALDTSAKKGLSQADQALWDSVRSQYAHLKTLVKGNTIEAGNVKPHLINGALAKFNPQMYKSGQINSPLNDIGMIAQNFKQAVPNSGTPERTAMQNMMFGNPITGVPSMALANAYARAYLSKPGQAYMTKGMVDLSPQMQALLAKSGMLLGGVGGSNLNK